MSSDKDLDSNPFVTALSAHVQDKMAKPENKTKKRSHTHEKGVLMYRDRIAKNPNHSADEYKKYLERDPDFNRKKYLQRREKKLEYERLRRERKREERDALNLFLETPIENPEKIDFEVDDGDNVQYNNNNNDWNEVLSRPLTDFLPQTPSEGGKRSRKRRRSRKKYNVNTKYNVRTRY